MVRSCHSRIIVFICAVFTSAGCAPPFPKYTLDKVNRSVSFLELQSDPAQFRGAWVMLGGMIVAAKNAKDGTLIEILQKPLDTNGRPLETDTTERRFLVQSTALVGFGRTSPGQTDNRYC